jgi:hypothetical protein
MSVLNRVLGAALLLLSTPVCWPQEFRATVSGRVTDAHGAMVPGVAIRATQKETGAKSETVSGSDGQYVLPFLTPGMYEVSAELAGFKRYVRQGLQVATDQRMTLDINLEVGQAAESVTVTADASMLEASTASVGQVITSRQIENMPMAGRTPLVLAQLSYGVIPTSDPKFYRPFDNAGPSDFSIGGTPGRSNDLLLDGAPNTTGNNRVAYNPPVDAVAEMKVETFPTDAAYGHSGGGTVNVVMRGGTNSFHGSLYEYNQVSRLAATPFFTNLAGLKKQVTRFNQYGGTIGGPVLIPKLFNGRDKVLFFFGYEGIKDSIPNPSTHTVPTAAERGGDFSQLLRLGANYRIYDPLTGVAEGGRIRREPFPNNIIPVSRLNPIALKYLQFYPAANQAGQPDGGDNFLSNTDGEINKFVGYLGRMDLNFSARHKIFMNARHNDRLGSKGNFVGKSPLDMTAILGLNRTNWGALVDDVYTFSPTLVLNTRVNWTRFEEPRPNFSTGFDMTTLGFPAALLAASPKATLPAIIPDRFNPIGDAGGVELPYDSFQIFSSLTKVAGKQTLKAGMDLRWMRESGIDFGYASGSYAFSTNWTRGPLDNSPGAPLGQDFAAFLLGMPTGGGFDMNSFRTNQAGYYAFFLQDDFRVKPNLILNMGLRYERDLPTTERFNRSVNGFDTLTLNPVSVAASAAYAANPIPEIPVGQFRAPGGLLFANSSNRRIYDTHANYFDPRFGFAWTPGVLGNKTVIRGGAGVFIFPLGTMGVNQIGFSQNTALVATQDGYLTPSATLSNPFPNGIQKPTGSSLALATFLGKGVAFYNPHPLNPYSIRWNVDVQRQLTNNLVVEAGYTGNHAVHLAVNRELNFIPRQYLSTLPVRDQAVIDRLSTNVTNPFSGLIPGTNLNGRTTTRGQLLLPFPEFTSVSMQGNNDGSSYFHEFSARLEQRFSSGLSLLANYQFSKLIEKRSRLNQSDPYLEKRVASEDRPQRLVVSGSYDLPFGKGKPIANSGGALLDRMVSGWVINGIYTVQPGPPIDWGNLIYYGGDLELDTRNIDRSFNTSRFNTSSLQQLASNIRTFPTRFGSLRGDGVNNLDASVIKNIPVRESVRLQFRFEAFNALNRAEFDLPNRNAVSSSFGRTQAQSNLPRRIQMALRLVW